MNSRAESDEVALFRSQAAALARALQEADEQQQAPRLENLAEETYRQLCFDDPVVTSRGCRALAESLVEKSGLALSNRLVHGVDQLCQRHQGGHELQTSVEEGESLLTSPGVDEDTNGVSLLAWTIYGQIPLLVLMSDHLEEATTLLGSFRTTDTEATAVEENEDKFIEAWEKRQNQQRQQQCQEEFSVEMEGRTSDKEGVSPQADELEEVWAAESDPSDYDFGSEPAPADRLAELEAWTKAFVVEPMEFSQSPDDTSWKDVAIAVSSLLQRLLYSSCLADLAAEGSWKRYKIVDQLTQLTLALFLPSTLPPSLFGEYDDSHWQQLALKPLHAFRDAVDEHTDLLLGDYCNLLVLLLQANYHTSRAPAVAETIAPATLVGLSAMSSLCNLCLEPNRKATSLGRKHISAMRNTILCVVNDLARILENSEVALSWTCLSLWQILAFELTTAQAQKLLQAGVYSQLMLSWQRHSSITSLRKAIQDSIFYLSCAAPTLLGKYAWRFAGFAASVTSMSTHDRTTTPAASIFLWNLLGIELARQATSGFVSLNKNEENLPAPSALACRNGAIAAIKALCRDIVNTLTIWKIRREDTANETDVTPNKIDEYSNIFDSFREIVEAVSIPRVRTLMLEILQDDGPDSFSITEAVAPIHRLLMVWPSFKISRNDKKKDVGDRTESNSKVLHVTDDITQPKHKKEQIQHEDQTINTLRHLLKVLQSSLEPVHDISGHFSSKTD